MMGGYMQGQQNRRLTDFAGGMDPNATGMQIIQDALRSGLPPQIAMGLGNLQSRMMPGVGVLPGWWSQASPEQRSGYVQRQTTPRTKSSSQIISEKRLKMIEDAEAKGDTERVERLMGIRSTGTGQTLDEQIKSYTALQNAAAGQYFAPGLEGGATAPKNKKVYDFATEKLEDLLAERSRQRGESESYYDPDNPPDKNIPLGTLDVNRIPPTAPRPFLDPYWKDLDDDTKSLVGRAVINGASQEEILAALKDRGSIK
jgi:hypothetical protein